MKRSLLVLLAIVCAGQAFAQAWLDTISQSYPNLNQARATFEAYWKDKEPEKGRGVKPFKRWEWFWEARVNPDGTLPDRSIAWKEWEKYNSGRLSRTSSPQSAAWTFSGPASSSSGYYGVGRLNVIAFHPTDPNTFYVGAPAGGLWKTTTGGTSWTPLTDHLPVIGVSGIAIDPTAPNTIYIATGDGDGSDTYSIGVLKSTDGGVTWSTTGLSFTTTNFKLIRRMHINPSNPQMLWVAASDGIWRTTNGGVNWTLVQSGNFSDLEIKPNDPNVLYAATYAVNSEVYRSTNAGLSFQQLVTITGGRRLNIALTPHSPTHIQVLTCNSSGGLHSLWKSTDGGDNFVQYYTGTTSNNMLHSSATGSGSGGQGTYDLAFVINPTDSNHVWLGGVNTWSSTNGGTTWNLKTAWSGGLSGAGGVPVVHADKHFQAYHPLNPSVLFECNDGGLYKTSDGGQNWTDLSAGLGISQIYRIGVSASTNGHVIAGLQDNSTKELKNNVWVDRFSTGDGFESHIDPTDPAVMYVSSYYGNIFKTSTGGSGWSNIVQTNGVGVNGAGAWLTPYTLNPLNSNILLIAKKEVYRSYNGGASWQPISFFGTTSNATSIVYAPSDTNTIYMSMGARLYRTTDGGGAWVNVFTAPTTISSIAVHPTNAQRIWIAHSGYSSLKVQTSTDGGATFTSISGTLPNLPVNTIVYQVGSNDGLYIGTDVGVYYRNATMTDWTPYMTGLPNVVVNELEIHYTTNRIWAATYGRGLWSSPLFGVAPCTAPAVPTGGGSQTICQNAPAVNLTATPPAGSTVDWYNTSTGGLPILSSTNVYTTSTPGTYYAESRNTTDGCLSTTRTAFTLTQLASPGTPFITAPSSTMFCSNSPVTLTSSASSGAQWFKDGSVITGATSATYTVTTSGSYTVRAVANGCMSPSSGSVSMSAIAAPAKPTISVSGSQLTSSSATGNQWFLNGTAISSATSQVYTATASGLYTVKVTASGCSSDFSDPHNHVGTSINSPVLEAHLRIAPNPVQRQLVITYTGTGAQFDIELVDLTGRKVLNNGRFTSRFVLNMESYPVGSYIVRVSNRRTGESVQKVIVKQ